MTRWQTVDQTDCVQQHHYPGDHTPAPRSPNQSVKPLSHQAYLQQCGLYIPSLLRILYKEKLSWSYVPCQHIACQYHCFHHVCNAKYFKRCQYWQWCFYFHQYFPQSCMSTSMQSVHSEPFAYSLQGEVFLELCSLSTFRLSVSLFSPCMQGGYVVWVGVPYVFTMYVMQSLVRFLCFLISAKLFIRTYSHCLNFHASLHLYHVINY